MTLEDAQSVGAALYQVLGALGANEKALDLASALANNDSLPFDPIELLPYLSDTSRGEAVAVAVRFGGIDGNHHKAWVIDQMVRHLTGDQYNQVVKDACAGANGPDSYDWDVGIAP